MAGSWLRPLAGALGAVPVLAVQQQRRLNCEDKQKAAFQTAKCVRNEAHTHNTRLITLALPGEWTTKGPIANVAVRARIADADDAATPAKEAAVTKPYNPLSADSGSNVTLLVKKYPDSKMGTKLHSLRAGDEIEVKGPNQQWTFVADKYSHYGMVAGGTGITPLLQAAEYIINHDTAKVTMVTFNKAPGDVLLRKRLAQLEVASGGRFRVFHVVESGATTSELEGTAASEELLEALLPEPGPGVMVMVCGRPAMTKAVSGPKTKDFKQGDVGGILKKLGYWTAQVWKV